ncbi:hypothetical protein LSAT2_018848 [Lamellibrachia satsuma]|nr:hypothetical protein LSAT2_018848 [Lamellibrachia satsuma]
MFVLCLTSDVTEQLAPVAVIRVVDEGEGNTRRGMSSTTQNPCNHGQAFSHQWRRSDVIIPSPYLYGELFIDVFVFVWRIIYRRNSEKKYHTHWI